MQAEPVALVVVPEVDQREPLVEALGEYGVKVMTTKGARDTLDLMDRLPVVALVVDAQLQKGSGFELVKSVRQHPRGKAAAIIIITDVRWTPSQKAAAIHQMGLLDLLVKPVEPDAVAELVLGVFTPEWGVGTGVGGPPWLGVSTDGKEMEPTVHDADDAIDTAVDEGWRGLATVMDPEDAIEHTHVDGPDRPRPEVSRADDDRTQVDGARGDGSGTDDDGTQIGGARGDGPGADDDGTQIGGARGDGLEEDDDGTRIDGARGDGLEEDDDGTRIDGARSSEEDEEPTLTDDGPFGEGDFDEEDGDDDTNVGPPPADLMQLVDPASHSEKRQVERATRAAQAEPAELRGNLTRTPFPKLLHELYQRRATGALFLLADRIKKIVYFKEGHPTYIKSNLLSECLGKVLVREKMITEAQCKESLRSMAESHRQQGTALLEMGVITPHDLVVGLGRQLRTKLLDIFTWTRGEFLFRRESKVPSDVISLDVSNATLIVDGLRSAWDVQRLKDAIQPYLERYPIHSTDPEMLFQDLALEADEQVLLESIDGTRTLLQILTESALPQRKALILAYSLLVTEVVETHTEPPDREGSAPEERAPLSEESLRERLAAEVLSFRQRDAFGVLGVSSGTTDPAVREAYNKAAREYHPDRHRHFSKETRRMAHEIFQLVNDAYHQIATAELRSEYRKGYSTREPSVTSQTSETALQAEDYRKKALNLIEQQEWSDARQLLANAVELCQDAGDLRSLLGWATYKAEPENASMVRTAIRELRRSIDLVPKHFEAYLCLGRIYAGMGKTILAEKQFEKALQCNPDCTEALDELKIQKQKRPPRRYRS